MILGSEIMSLVTGLRMVERLGWFLALGWRPAAVLRLVWYFFELFVESVFLSAEGVHELVVGFTNYGNDGCMTEGGDVF
jgi:hypothetical protein